MATIPEYAELRCVSNFTFLRGASQPEELVERAMKLGYQALAIADECSLSGVVRAHVAGDGGIFGAGKSVIDGDWCRIGDRPRERRRGKRPGCICRRDSDTVDAARSAGGCVAVYCSGNETCCRID